MVHALEQAHRVLCDGGILADIRPGQSGNPGGRPKVIGEVRDLARQYTSLAVETLAHIMEHGDKDAARVAAALALLDRGWGKAVQAVEMSDHSTPVTIVVRHSDDASSVRKGPA
jgi:hypothetical protein